MGMSRCVTRISVSTPITPNTTTQPGELELQGHVQFDSTTQHIEAEKGQYDVRKNSGTFSDAHGTVQTPHPSKPGILLSTNPIYFEAQEVERIDEQTYKFHSVWMTVCVPQRPLWKFFAAEATLRVDERVALINSNFRILRIPLFYTPYASLPAGPKQRQSGFTVPYLADTTNKGIVLGDSFYWAPVDWMDAENWRRAMHAQGLEPERRPSRQADGDQRHYLSIFWRPGPRAPRAGRPRPFPERA